MLLHIYKIVNGIFHFLFSSRIESRKRLAICQSCIYFDQKGETEKVVLKGKPACSICGCNIKLLTACRACDCSLADINEEPKWTAI